MIYRATYSQLNQYDAIISILDLLGANNNSQIFTSCADLNFSLFLENYNNQYNMKTSQNQDLNNVHQQDQQIIKHMLNNSSSQTQFNLNPNSIDNGTINRTTSIAVNAAASTGELASNTNNSHLNNIINQLNQSIAKTQNILQQNTIDSNCSEHYKGDRISGANNHKLSTYDSSNRKK